MGIKSILKYLIIIVLYFFFNCKKDVEKNNSSSKAIIENKTDDFNLKEAKEFIKLFYLTCYKDENVKQDNNSLKKFISNRLLDRLETINTRDNIVLSYDPFIKAQDYNSEVIRETLRVTESQNTNEFKVSFNLFELENETPTHVLLYLVKDNNSYLVDAVNSNKYLSLTEINKFSKNYRNTKKKEKQTINTPQSNSKIENYIGSYFYFYDMGKLDEIASMTIGYSIEVKKDTIIFSGQGYKTNFKDLCEAKINNDVLELHYKKTIEGNEYNANSKQPLAKIYKRGKNFFATCPDIKNSEEIKLEKK